VVEFNAPRSLVAMLFATQQMVEDGAMSHGLGDKGGKSLPLFNAALRSGDVSILCLSRGSRANNRGEMAR